MRKVIEAVLNGKYECEHAQSRQADKRRLEFSTAEIELSLKPEEAAGGSFYIYAQEEIPVQGYVYASGLQMECLTEEFSGIREEIHYRFCGEGIEEGEVREGCFYIISNYGEYEIPYRVTVEEQEIKSGIGVIRNMFHFANLAKENWNEAVKIFYSKEFKRLFAEGADRQYYTVYKGLSAVYGNEQNVEEFLLELHKKQQVLYTPQQMQIRLDEADGVTEYSLSVTKSGWGYTFFKIEADGEFLSVEKEQASEHDFLGNSFHLVYYVNHEKLHAGRNYGSLRIYNAYMDQRIPVTIVCSTKRQRSFGIGREKKKLLIRLVEYYCNYKGKKITAKTWMEETQVLTDRLAALDGKDVQAKLFQIQLLLTREQYEEARYGLERIQEEMELEGQPQEVVCYYLYLTTLLDEDEGYVEQISKRVEKAYLAQPGNWRIAWLLLYLSDEYVKSFSRRWFLLEEQFKQNCTSPVLYAEAWHLLEMNPTLLNKFGAFEVQVLTFAAKWGLLNEDIVVQIRFQIQKLKEFSRQALYILKECYEKYPDKETLQAICTLLIKGSKTDSCYFEWYSMGVEQELRITKLYEYYMMALPEDYTGELPRMVLMYFAYQSDLDYRKNAFLYQYVYERRQEEPEYYIKYCERIDQFVKQQIKRGRINHKLAYLYKNILKPEQIDEELAGALLPLLFTHSFYTENKEIREVVVQYAITREEYCYPVSAGRAYVPLYGEDYKVLLKDTQGNRYTVSIPYELERLMNPEDFIQTVSAYTADHEGLDIYLCEGQRAYTQMTKENEHRFRYIAGLAGVEQQQKNEICLKLIHYYYENDQMAQLDEYLTQIVPEDKTKYERNEIMRFMVLRGMYDQTLEWMTRFGIEGVDVKTLVRLCSRLIARDGYVENKKLTRLVHEVFKKGKYDEKLLLYLVYFYQGTIENQMDIWRAAREFETNTYELCERILVQMLFAGTAVGERMSVFREYVAGGARTEVELAFLLWSSYEYFVKQQETDSFVFEDMGKVHERREPLRKLCQLAFLKYYAEHKSCLTPRLRNAAEDFLNALLGEELCFGFYKEYAGEMPQLARYEDKTIVEYRTRNAGKVVIHYRLEEDENSAGEYCQEEMREMYQGIYAKPFVLFYGEKLHYYITEETDRMQQVTESTFVNPADDMQGEQGSRFAMINDILTGAALQDYATVDMLLEDYYQKEYIASRLFKLK